MSASLGGVPVNESNISNLKDMLQTYNRITEQCFQRCAKCFNSIGLNEDEKMCVESCSSKFVAGNQKMIATFVELQQKKNKEATDEAAKLAAKQATDEAANLAAKQAETEEKSDT
ncbi:DgyrCDS5198 [Dimorphilus gyrociliatus]|uniref:Mitochondrial import inner membrane translocase subunit n=1 Tax=Dimorphilus gyrociliatus TaxID=2664684 RepID=A0A7I8VKS1_9ANNE|nr:DgyrCDS5198 [Dimorphilus gyrociliatus]